MSTPILSSNIYILFYMFGVLGLLVRSWGGAGQGGLGGRAQVVVVYLRSVGEARSAVGWHLVRSWGLRGLKGRKSDIVAYATKCWSGASWGGVTPSPHPPPTHPLRPDNPSGMGWYPPADQDTGGEYPLPASGCEGPSDFCPPSPPSICYNQRGWGRNTPPR